MQLFRSTLHFLHLKWMNNYQLIRIMFILIRIFKRKKTKGKYSKKCQNLSNNLKKLNNKYILLHFLLNKSCLLHICLVDKLSLNIEQKLLFLHNSEKKKKKCANRIDFVQWNSHHQKVWNKKELDNPNNYLQEIYQRVKLIKQFWMKKKFLTDDLMA